MARAPDRSRVTYSRERPAWRRHLTHLGVDRATALAMGGNIASFVLGPITALVVAARLTPELQGFYYTFGSLSVLQLLAEFGLGQAMIQFASHRWPSLRMGPGGALLGDPDARNYLAGLARISLRWCTTLAILLLPVLAIAGELLFAEQGRLIAWRGPWLVVAIGLVGNLFLTPIWALLQGCHETVGFWSYRLAQQILNGVTLWIALIATSGLWALAVSSMVGLCWSVGFVWVRYPHFVTSLYKTAPGPVQWWKEIWPLQWRTAITWMGANFTSYLFAPVLFRTAGPVEAGKMGMTVTLASVLTAFASNIIVTKGPVFGALVAEKRIAELNRIFRRQMVLVLLVALAGSTAIVAAIRVIGLLRLPLQARLLSPVPAAMLMGYATATALLVSTGVYVRAHKSDPMGLLNVVGTTIVLIGGGVLAQRMGAAGISAVALAVAACLQLPWAAFIVARRARSAESEAVERVR